MARVDLDIITMACHTQMVDRDILVARNLVQLNSLVVVEDIHAIGGIIEEARLRQAIDQNIMTARNLVMHDAGDIVVKDKKVRLKGIIEDILEEA